MADLDVRPCPEHGPTKPEPDTCPGCAGFDWCYIHNRREPMVPGGIACGECWHVYANEQELIDAHNAWDGPQVTSVEQIFSCPLCVHDF